VSVSDLPAVVASTPPRVVACRRPCLRVARPPGVDDVAGVAISGLPASVEEPLFGRRAPRVGGALRCSARVHRGFGALRAPIVPCAPLLTNAGRRAFGLLDGRLLDERLRLAVQVSRLGCRRGGHGPQQCRGGDELLACSWGRIRIVDVEVGVDAIAGLSAQLTRAFAARGGFPRDGGAKQMHRVVLFRQLGFELARLGQLCVDVGPPGGEGGGALDPAARRDLVPRAGGTSPSPAPAAMAAFAGSLAMTTQHSRAGS
jgi:hypothetical protein